MCRLLVQLNEKIDNLGNNNINNNNNNDFIVNKVNTKEELEELEAHLQNSDKVNDFVSFINAHINLRYKHYSITKIHHWACYQSNSRSSQWRCSVK